MAESEINCPKCRARMQPGFILDNTYGGRIVSKWIEGAPERSVWLGLSLKGKKVVDIVTYRCPSCGYLESYAK
jgi:predicted nucleic-acid-binding Zn-ribbon protein